MSSAKERGTHLSTSRVDFADGLKSISMLYIVGFWHMIDYSVNPAQYHSNALRTFTLVLLSVFVLLSGYFSAVQMRKPGKTARNFFASKLKGVYAPFILALMFCVFAGLFGIKWAIGSGLLYGMFTGEPPMTLWFVCMLVMFFLASPTLFVILEKTPRLSGDVLVLSAFVGLSVWAIERGVALDSRVIFYFPAYVLGLIVGMVGVGCVLHRFWVILAALAFVVSFPQAVSVNKGSSVAGVELVPSLSAAVLVLVAFPYLWRFFPKAWKSALLWFSGQSYFVYLFHRPIIEAWRKLLAKFGAEALLHLDFLGSALVNMPVVLLVSYLLLKAYVRWIDPMVAVLAHRLSGDAARPTVVGG